MKKTTETAGEVRALTEITEAERQVEQENIKREK